MSPRLDRVAELIGDAATRDAPLGARTTYRVGGTARVFVEARSEDDLQGVARAIAEAGVDAVVVGNGSNLLVADAGFDGVAVALGEPFARVEVDGTTVRAGGATSLPVLARRTAAASLTGLEWAVGVPGTVGGAVRMNAGGHGSDVAATLRRVRVLDLAGGEHGHVHDVDAGGLDLGYRTSRVRTDQVVVEAEFALLPGDRERSEREIADIVRWRREHQPGGQNAGSVFTNPPGDSAGRLIDEAGLKGLRVGSAQVSEKHANFFQADDGGSADDVLALIAEVQRRVERASGVRLRPELRMVGFADERLAPLR